MLIRFYVSHGPGREIKDRVFAVAEGLTIGAAAFGDTVEMVHNADFVDADPDVDVACLWGVVGNAKRIVAAYLAAGKRVLMFDKALIRRLGNERQGHYRVGMDGPSPLKYLMRTMKSFERWESHRIDLKPRQVLEHRGAILYAGSSQKYCDFYDLGDANDYAEGIFNTIRTVTRKNELIYRPKPSWQGSREIVGTRMSGGDQPLTLALQKSDVLITHGSAAAVEAIACGVPAITLGPCVARPVASHSLDDLRDLTFPSDHARFLFLSNVAWCQWTVDELRTGEAWKFLRGELVATANDPLSAS